MTIDKTNKQAVHDVLISDMQKRLFNNHKIMLTTHPSITDEDYDNALSVMVDSILHCDSINDINNLLLEYSDLYDKGKDISHLFSLDGTMNYVIGLLLNNNKLTSENGVKPITNPTNYIL